jgi:hypothetical protein
MTGAEHPFETIVTQRILAGELIPELQKRPWDHILQ